MSTYVNEKDLPLFLEIATNPDDCLLNHKVSKSALKRLIGEGLIEVETRRISTWFNQNPAPQFKTHAEQREWWAEWDRIRRARKWKDRSEVHACLTEQGRQHFVRFVSERTGE